LKSIYPEGIPPTLKSIPQWVLWKNVVTEQYPRGKKIPLCDKGTFTDAGSSTDPATWGNYENTLSAMDKFKTSGIGFVLTKPAGIFCVDIDQCVGDGGISEFGLEVLKTFKDKTYVELSYHNDGLHIMGKGNLPIDEKGGERKGIEIYDAGRYIAITGKRKKSSSFDLTDCQTELNELLIKFPKRQKYIPKTNPTPKTFNGFTISVQLGLSCERIGYPTDAYKCGHGLQGAHPFHGSTTGSNYCINTQDNTWYCFRHQSGGGALELYAISKGIISCEDSGRGCLTDVWGDVFEELEKDGYQLKKTGSLYTIYSKRKELRLKLKSLGVL
jgi:primase-polymerase (primpol)-like protein